MLSCKASNILAFELYGRIGTNAFFEMRFQILMFFLRKLSLTHFYGRKQSIHLLIIVVMIGGHTHFFVWVFIFDLF